MIFHNFFIIFAWNIIEKSQYWAISTRVWQTDGRTDGRTDRRTDSPSYKDARTHPKRFFGLRSLSSYICHIYLDSRSALLLEQHVLWFHITMNDFVFVEHVQTLQHAVGKLADELKTEALSESLRGGRKGSVLGLIKHIEFVLWSNEPTIPFYMSFF